MSERIVVKIGSQVLCDPQGDLNREVMASLVAQLGRLAAQGIGVFFLFLDDLMHDRVVNSDHLARVFHGAGHIDVIAKRHADPVRNGRLPVARWAVKQARPPGADRGTEVIQKLVGRKAQLLYVEEEDGFRDLYRRLASAPQARVPRGRHWRVGIRGDAPAAYSLAVAAKGPLSMVGLKLSGLERVESGDAHFDDWAVVYTDRPASVARLLAAPDRRATLLRMLTRNGSYVSWVQVRPPRGPSDPCVGMGFALHAQQTAHDVVDNLHDLVTLAGWTREPS